MRLLWTLGFVVCASCAFSCGGDDSSTGSTADATAPDGTTTSPHDAGIDTADDARVIDAKAADSAAADTSSTDAQIVDAYFADTNIADTNIADTNIADTNMADVDVIDASDEADACSSTVVAYTTTPGNIIVLFDQSDSMGQPFTGTTPKWQGARDAIVDGLTSYEASLNVGTIFYPTFATGNTCSLVAPIGTAPQIPIEPGATFVTDFGAHFAASGWTLILGTPMVAALNATNLALPDPSPLTGARAVLLVTDGAPTCDTVTADVLAPVQSMFARGIGTYVIGLPGSAGAATLLNAIAASGGTGSYLAPADTATMQTEVSQIGSDVSDPCALNLAVAPVDPSQLHLIATDAAHPGGYEITQGDASDGWSVSGAVVTLTGAVCTEQRAGGFTSLQTVYGCVAP